ncbi:uncharacterized protein LOC107267791 [Cephus cinctus]|uniref:Uncharacterized protein LOC107267791 n=1 Tax=Cephus cinctus TaxID=211228 RepID=A0AAJ7BWC4_CEPCN|nr:uncharacterized protein LOC107267791 [Cephus cinctus]XP_015595378.1 uncharacterized protein LOC107267791 [Cephus cinctus]XP_015595379.1 uncharacterized protein LOC107267791 [Cephus cinctus]XP_015595380.1 uncharacterized protein LOC107267791 [Cephus cinctus]
MLPHFVNKSDVHKWVKKLWIDSARQHLSDLGVNPEGTIQILKDRLIRCIVRTYFDADVLWELEDEEDSGSNSNFPGKYFLKEPKNPPKRFKRCTSEPELASFREDMLNLVDGHKIAAIPMEESETLTTEDSCSQNRDNHEDAKESSLLADIPRSSSSLVTMHMPFIQHKETVIPHNNTLRNEKDGEHRREEVATFQDGDKISSRTKNSRENYPTYPPRHNKSTHDDKQRQFISFWGRKRFRNKNNSTYENLHDRSEDCSYDRYRSCKISRADYDSSQGNGRYRSEEGKEEFRFRNRSMDNEHKETSRRTQNQGHEDMINNPIDRASNYSDSGSDRDHSDYPGGVNDHIKSNPNLPDYARDIKENSNEVYKHDCWKSDQRKLSAFKSRFNRGDEVDVCINIKKEDVSQDVEHDVGVSQDNFDTLDSVPQIIQDNQLETASNPCCMHAAYLRSIQEYSQHCCDGPSIIFINRKVTTDCTDLMVLENMAVKLAKKWQIKFTGQDGCTVQEFIQKVNMHRKGTSITDDELLKVLPSWLEGRAAQWWNITHHRWRNWSEFLTDFETMYAGPIYQQRVREELRLRTQGPKESLMDYLISVQNIMSHLRPQLSEREKLDLIMDNLHPDMYPYFSPKPFRSMEEVQEQMMVIDARRARARYYRVPPLPQDSLFPENAYQR